MSIHQATPDAEYLRQMQTAIQSAASDEATDYFAKEKAAINNLAELVKTMKAQGLCQEKIYTIFETFIIARDDEDEDSPLGFERIVAGDVGCWVWGWGGDLFDGLLDDEQIAQWRETGFSKADALNERKHHETLGQKVLDL